MTLEARLKKIILSRYRTIKDFAADIDLAYSTVDTILRRGVNKASVTNIITICHALNISVDELAQGRIVAVDTSAAKKTNIEVSNLLEVLRVDNSAYGELTVSGCKLTEDDFSIIETALGVAVAIIERKKSVTSES